MFYVDKIKQYFIISKNLEYDFSYYIGLSNYKGLLEEPLFKIKIKNEPYYYEEELYQWQVYDNYLPTTQQPNEIIFRKKYFYEIKPNLTPYYLDYFLSTNYNDLNFNVGIYLITDTLSEMIIDYINIPLKYIYLPLLFDIPYKDYKVDIIFPKKTKQSITKNNEVYNEMNYPNLKIHLPLINGLQKNFIINTFCDVFTYYIESMFEQNFIGKFLIPIWFLQKQYTYDGKIIKLDKTGWEFFFNLEKINMVLFYDINNTNNQPFKLFKVTLLDEIINNTYQQVFVVDTSNNNGWLKSGKTYFYMPIAITILDNSNIDYTKKNNLFNQALTLRVIDYV